MNTTLPIKANGIVFKEVNDVPMFLLLKRTQQDGGFWQNITGTATDNESIVQTLVREIAEEAGIMEDKIYEISDLIYSFTWNKGEQIIQEFVYTVRVDDVDIVLSPDEHDEYAWVTFQDAILLLGRDNNIISLSKGFKQIKEKRS
jgi:8-oxo-dGTP pyrophosphatase MutT (NUDIX family)